MLLNHQYEFKLNVMPCMIVSRDRFSSNTGTIISCHIVSQEKDGKNQIHEVNHLFFCFDVVFSVCFEDWNGYFYSVNVRTCCGNLREGLFSLCHALHDRRNIMVRFHRTRPTLEVFRLAKCTDKKGLILSRKCTLLSFQVTKDDGTVSDGRR